MVRISWTIQAKNDLQDIAEYIGRDSRKYAQIQIIRLLARTKILKTNPHSGKIVPEINQAEIRELIQGNYRIIYKIKSTNAVDILTIHHSSRDLRKRKI